MVVNGTLSYFTSQTMWRSASGAAIWYAILFLLFCFCRFDKKCDILSKWHIIECCVHMANIKNMGWMRGFLDATGANAAREFAFGLFWRCDDDVPNDRDLWCFWIKCILFKLIFR